MYFILYLFMLSKCYLCKVFCTALALPTFTNLRGLNNNNEALNLNYNTYNSILCIHHENFPKKRVTIAEVKKKIASRGD
ncbi:hypothetical protein BYT27DRAFT_6942423 [Phlegmacium glaucopus]|nr:hypothetical protein BYT27DRAFT_6942423 [Phlegmacium glaucopus]